MARRAAPPQFVFKVFDLPLIGRHSASGKCR
jgi:hypothetical protein